MSVLFTVTTGTLISYAKTGGSAYRTIALIHVSGGAIYNALTLPSLTGSSVDVMNPPQISGMIYTHDTMVPPRRAVLYAHIAYMLLHTRQTYCHPRREVEQMFLLISY